MRPRSLHLRLRQTRTCRPTAQHNLRSDTAMHSAASALARSNAPTSVLALRRRPRTAIRPSCHLLDPLVPPVCLVNQIAGPARKARANTGSLQPRGAARSRSCSTVSSRRVLVFWSIAGAMTCASWHRLRLLRAARRSASPISAIDPRSCSTVALATICETSWLARRSRSLPPGTPDRFHGVHPRRTQPPHAGGTGQRDHGALG